MHPRNGEQVIAQMLTSPGQNLEKRVQHGEVPGGYRYRRSIHTDTGGRALAEASNGKIDFVRCDVTRPSDIEALMKEEGMLQRYPLDRP